MLTRAKAVMEQVCGDGICAPSEYPGVGRFGCTSDCGSQVSFAASVMKNTIDCDCTLCDRLDALGLHGVKNVSVQCFMMFISCYPYELLRCLEDKLHHDDAIV